MYVSTKVIGKNIRAARLAKHLTQEQLAEQLGFSSLHCGRIERGERPASLELLAGFADVLGVPASSLLRGCFLNEPYSEAPTEASLTFAEKLARMTASCTPQEQELMLDICELIVRQGKRDGV